MIFLLITSIYAKMHYSFLQIDGNKYVKSNDSSKEILASVSKLISLNFALDVLGEDFTFKTEVTYTGKINNKVLIGDLYIKGGDDPFFTLQDLLYLIESLNINQVKGNIYLVGKNYRKRVSNLGLEDQADNPSLGSFNLEFNRFKVYTNGLWTYPIDIPIIEKKFSREDDFVFDKKWYLNTSEKSKWKVDLPVKDSIKFFAENFHYLAKKHNKIFPYPKIKKSKFGKPLRIINSLPLKNLVRLCFEYSNNVLAEMIFKKALEKKSFDKWLKKYQLDKLENASGHTLNNRLSTKSLVNFLKKRHKEKPFLSYLSFNGHSGGLSKRLNSKDLKLSVYAKTGSLYFVQNLAGYLYTKKGNLYAFALLMTQESKRKLLTKNLLNGDRLREEAKIWGQNANSQIDALISNFLRKN